MNRLLIAVLLCVVVSLVLCSCDNSSDNTDSGYPTMDPVQTGITPSLGVYSINAKGSFRVIATNAVRYSYDGYAFYVVPVHSGGISFSNGQYYWLLNGEKVMMSDQSGNCYPTDGFAIWAQWTSPNHCEGTIWFNSSIGVPFRASR